MSYPKDLEDYSDEELSREIARRCATRSLGECDYCRRPQARISCGSGRHKRSADDMRVELRKLGVTP